MTKPDKDKPTKEEKEEKKEAAAEARAEAKEERENQTPPSEQTPEIENLKKIVGGVEIDIKVRRPE